MNIPVADFTSSKNPTTKSSDALYIELNNISPSLFVTASLSDEPLLAQHRWRYVHNRVLTVGQEGITADMGNLIMDYPRTEQVSFRSGNKFDFRRENLKPLSLNRIVEKDDVGFIHLRNGHKALVDVEDIPRLRKTHWSLQERTKANNRILLTVRSVAKAESGSRNRLLSRVVLNLPNGSGKIVIHKNGNRLDCRKSNLEVTDTYEA